MPLKKLIHGSKVKLVTLLIGLAILGGLGYVPWNYASVCETYRLELNPSCSFEFLTLLGMECRIFALLFWAGGCLSLAYVLYKKELVSFWSGGKRQA